MSTFEKLARPIAMIAIGAAAMLATPALASANPAPSATPTTSAADSDSDSVGRKVDKTGWYGGFAITVDEVTTKVNGGAGKLDLELSYENLVGETLTPPDKAYLEVNGGEVVDISFNNKKIAGFGKGKGAATASLGSTDEDLDEVLDNTVLVYGEADGNLTKIPFAEDEKVQSVEPRGITVGQTFGEDMVMKLDEAFLWPSYQPGEKDKSELWVKIDANCGSCSTGGYGDVNPGDFELIAPDGRSVRAGDRSLLVAENVFSTGGIEGEWLVFVVGAPATGTYTFKWVNTSKVYPAESTTTITL